MHVIVLTIKVATINTYTANYTIIAADYNIPT